MIDEVKQFLAHPFSVDMDWKHWIAFLAFVAAVSFGWKVITMHLFGDI